MRTTGEEYATVPGASGILSKLENAAAKASVLLAVLIILQPG
jgi:hypothetical protein